MRISENNLVAGSTIVDSFASNYKCHASSNKCLTSSNKKLLELDLKHVKFSRNSDWT